MTQRIAIAVAAVLAAAATSAVPADAKLAVLKGEVTDDFQIRLTRNGMPVRTVKAGTYRIHIEDESDAHNFRLRGPRVNRVTGVLFVGKRVWTVTLRRGRYAFECDQHVSAMRGTFRVVR